MPGEAKAVEAAAARIRANLAKYGPSYDPYTRIYGKGRKVGRGVRRYKMVGHGIRRYKMKSKGKGKGHCGRKKR